MRRPLLIICLLAVAQPASAQALFDNSMLRSLSVGGGAGAAAAVNHGRVVKRSAASAVALQQAVASQTKAIAESVSRGVKFEAGKQFEEAEKAYMAALQLIARRDGPGSEKQVPVLQNLERVAKVQNKLDDAIRYQQTVVAFTERKHEDEQTVKAEAELANLLVGKSDYKAAEPVAAKCVQIVQKSPKISPTQRLTTLRVYGKILRELHKDEEAKAVEEAITSEQTSPPTAVSATPMDKATETPVEATAPSAVPVSPAVPPESSTTDSGSAPPSETKSHEPSR